MRPVSLNLYLIYIILLLDFLLCLEASQERIVQIKSLKAQGNSHLDAKLMKQAFTIAYVWVFTLELLSLMEHNEKLEKIGTPNIYRTM